MGYTKEAVSGVFWVSGLRGSTRIVSFIKTLILARILTPFEFGVFGVAFLVLSFLEVITETGINVFLLQKDEEESYSYVNTSWVVSIVRGILISLVLLLLSWPLVMFFRVSEAYGVLLLTALIPFLRGFINPSIIYFQKRLNFAKDFWFRFIIFCSDALASILFAYIYKSAYGVILGVIFGVLVEILLSFVLAYPRPRLRFEKNLLFEVVNRGKWITSAGIFQYFFREVDDMVVARLLGASQLGVYQVSYKIATLPISEIGEVFGKVTLPVFSRISKDKKRLLSAYKRVSVVVFLFSLAMGSFLIIFAPFIVKVLLGEKWFDAISVIRIICLYAVIRTMIHPSFTLFFALEKQEYVTYVTLGGIIGLGVTVVPLVVKYGLIGAGFSTIFGVIFMLPICLYYVFKVLRE